MNDDNKWIIGCIGFICIWIVALLVLFLIVAGLTYLIFLGLGIVWNWCIPLAIVALMLLLAIAARIIR